MLKWVLCLLAAAGWLASQAAAQAPVTVTIARKPPGAVIPADFLGLSFETANVLPAKNGSYLFSSTNQPLINLFRTIGIKNLRIGGGTAELPNYPEPRPADLDQLFAFARAAGVKVIYTLRLLNGNRTNAAAVARYLAARYPAQLDCFALGNEPDWHAYHSYPGHPLDPAIFETVPGLPGSAYPSFLAKWRSFATAITRLAPHAIFGGPDTGSNYPVPGAKDTDYGGESWTEHFVEDERASHRIVAAFLHDYVGQSASGISADAASHAMLSRTWVLTNYPALYRHVLARVKSSALVDDAEAVDGVQALKPHELSYRLTECNDYTGGVDGASSGFVSALWALDYLHWHAAHGAAGMNFHNKRWIRTCTILQDASGAFRVNPKAYGLKTFALGASGRLASLQLENPDALNLTAYAVRDTDELFVTLINKEFGPTAVPANVVLAAAGATNPAAVIFLAGHGDPSAKTGITLGGATISADAPWTGRWQDLPPERSGRYELNLPPLSAALVRIPFPRD